MLYSALIVLTVGLIAPALTLFGTAAPGGKVVWILFCIGMVLLGILFLMEGRFSPAGWPPRHKNAPKR